MGHLDTNEQSSVKITSQGGMCLKGQEKGIFWGAAETDGGGGSFVGLG